MQPDAEPQSEPQSHAVKDAESNAQRNGDARPKPHGELHLARKPSPCGTGSATESRFIYGDRTGGQGVGIPRGGSAAPADEIVSQVAPRTHDTRDRSCAEQAPPDVVVLDMRMPVMDGWEFTQRYRQGTQPRGHIVVMTAAIDALESAGQIDVDTVLAKPFDLNDLLSCVAQYAPPDRRPAQWM